MRRKRATPCAATCTSCAALSSKPGTTIRSTPCMASAIASSPGRAHRLADLPASARRMVRPRKPDLRLRIAAALATISIAVVGALGFTLYTASREMEQTLVDQIVSEELDFLVERGRPVLPSGPTLQYYVLRPPADYDRIPANLRKLEAGRHDVGSGGEKLKVAVRDSGDARYIVAYDAGPHELRERRFR